MRSDVAGGCGLVDRSDALVTAIGSSSVGPNGEISMSNFSRLKAVQAARLAPVFACHIQTATASSKKPKESTPRTLVVMAT